MTGLDWKRRAAEMKVPEEYMGRDLTGGAQEVVAMDAEGLLADLGPWLTPAALSLSPGEMTGQRIVQRAHAMRKSASIEAARMVLERDHREAGASPTTWIEP
jgi:hypothetical protein